MQKAQEWTHYLLWNGKLSPCEAEAMLFPLAAG